MGKKGSLNPADAFRREQKKKEVARNKRTRDAVREVSVGYKDPEKIREAIARYKRTEEGGGTLDNVQVKHLQQLEKELRICLERRSEKEEAAKNVTRVNLSGLLHQGGEESDDDRDDGDDGMKRAYLASRSGRKDTDSDESSEDESSDGSESGGPHAASGSAHIDAGAGAGTTSSQGAKPTPSSNSAEPPPAKRARADSGAATATRVASDSIYYDAVDNPRAFPPPGAVQQWKDGSTGGAIGDTYTIPGGIDTKASSVLPLPVVPHATQGHARPHILASFPMLPPHMAMSVPPFPRPFMSMPPPGFPPGLPPGFPPGFPPYGAMPSMHSQMAPRGGYPQASSIWAATGPGSGVGSGSGALLPIPAGASATPLLPPPTSAISGTGTSSRTGTGTAGVDMGGGSGYAPGGGAWQQPPPDANSSAYAAMYQQMAAYQMMMMNAAATSSGSSGTHAGMGQTTPPPQPQHPSVSSHGHAPMPSSGSGGGPRGLLQPRPSTTVTETPLSAPGIAVPATTTTTPVPVPEGVTSQAVHPPVPSKSTAAPFNPGVRALVPTNLLKRKDRPTGFTGSSVPRSTGPLPASGGVTQARSSGGTQHATHTYTATAPAPTGIPGVATAVPAPTGARILRLPGASGIGAETLPSSSAVPGPSSTGGSSMIGSGAPRLSATADYEAFMREISDITQ